MKLINDSFKMKQYNINIAFQNIAFQNITTFKIMLYNYKTKLATPFFFTSPKFEAEQNNEAIFCEKR